MRLHQVGANKMFVWNLVVFVSSAVTGWWAHWQPYTFASSVALGTVPLLAGIWKLSMKVRAVER